jgi:hypothetical protein
MGFPGYAVGSDGSVWSQWRIGRPYGLDELWHRLSHALAPGGYPIVNLAAGEGRYRMRRIGRLQLEAFVGPCPPGKECCHFDGNPANSNLDNLRWDTRLANMDDRRRHGRDKQWKKRKLTAAAAAEVRALRAAGWTWSALAKKFGVTKRPIRAIVAGETYS